jgi:D-amino-acid oxidase
MPGRVTVVGAGVVGLTCAVRLAEAGAEVNLLSRDLPLETTSAVAGGLWLPYLSEPFDDVVRWGRTALAEFIRLAGPDGRSGAGPDGALTGVRMLPGTLLQRSGPTAEPAWSAYVADVVRLTPVRDPAPGYGFGHRVTIPVVDMPVYLEYLVARLRAAGGTLTRLPLAALPTRGIVVNCTGVAARALAADPAVHPVRGQVALLADPGLDEWWCDDTSEQLTYVIPRGRDVVVGGTLDDGNWDTTPDDATARRLIARAVDVVPALRGARVLGHRVGLRPARPVIRLEVEQRPTPEDRDHVRVHCYGHGGSGVTLSWGCADEVAALVGALLDAPALF